MFVQLNQIEIRHIEMNFYPVLYLKNIVLVNPMAGYKDKTITHKAQIERLRWVRMLKILIRQEIENITKI